MEFIALDIGTSFTKGAVVDVERLSIRNVQRVASPSQQSSDNSLHYELDPINVVTGVRQIIKQLANAAPEAVGIQITGQMGGLVLCNPDGTARRPYISWLDRRATGRRSPQAETYFGSLTRIVGKRAADILGNEFRPGLPLSFLYTLAESDELDRHSGAIPVTLPDFVAAALCNAAPVMEWTAATGLADVRQRKFPIELFAELRLDRLQLPPLVDFRHCVGTYSADGKDIPVYAATGDHQCALLGTLLREDELSINVSTGSQVSLLTEDPVAGDYQVRPFFDGRFLKTITNIPAGRALTAVIGLLTEMSPREPDLKSAYRQFFEYAESTPESDVEVNLGLFPGAVAGPGSFGNLNEGNLTVGHIARACLNQMATTYQQMATRLDTAHSWSRIAFSGGIAQMSPLLRQLVSESLDSEHRLAADTEDSLMGMIVLGRIIGGLDHTVAESTDFVARTLAARTT